MRRAVLLTAVVVIVVGTGLYSSGMLHAGAYSTYFGFPTAPELGSLMSRTYQQTSPGALNTTNSVAFQAYGLTKTETTAFMTGGNRTAEAYIFITEFSFSSKGNASSFYDAGLFGDMAVQNISAGADRLNMSYRGAVYSILTIATPSRPLHLMLGHRQNYVFTVLVTDNAQYRQLVSLARLVIDKMS